MPILPYTSEELVDILDKNASLHDAYEESAEVIEAAATDIQSASSGLQGALSDFQNAANEFVQNGAIIPLVVNESGLTPTGSYANATYYNVDFGAKIAYDRLGNIFLVMKGGTSTDYEYLYFIAGTVPDSVTIEQTCQYSSSSYVSMTPNMMQVAIIHGVQGKVSLKLTMGEQNSSYDWVKVTIDVTEAE